MSTLGQFSAEVRQGPQTPVAPHPHSDLHSVGLVQKYPVVKAMPSNRPSLHKNDLARAMVAQTEQAFLAIAQGNAPKERTVKILESKDMEPFFVKGEGGKP
jgi:hypothetical protein